MKFISWNTNGLRACVRTAKTRWSPLCAGMLCGLIGVLIHSVFESIWEEPYFYSCKNTVMVHIRNIRQKVGSGAICTVWGKGYRMGPSKP